MGPSQNGYRRDLKEVLALKRPQGLIWSTELFSESRLIIQKALGRVNGFPVGGGKQAFEPCVASRIWHGKPFKPVRMALKPQDETGMKGRLRLGGLLGWSFPRMVFFVDPDCSQHLFTVPDIRGSRESLKLIHNPFDWRCSICNVEFEIKARFKLGTDLFVPVKSPDVKDCVGSFFRMVVSEFIEGRL